MGIRGMLRAAVLLLLIRTWLSEGNDVSPLPEFHFELSDTMPELVQNVFDCKNCANEDVVHKIWDRVLSGYDARLRPNFGGTPVPVGISMYVSSIEEISEMSMDYAITMFFHQTWKDPRLAYNETDQSLTLDYQMFEKLWVPDCYFLNSKDALVHDMTVNGRIFQLHPDGTVQYGMWLTTIAACFLNERRFPVRKQTCRLEMESYGYTVEDIMLYWEGGEDAIQGTEEIDVPEFSLLGKTVTSKQVHFYTGSYVRLILEFLVQKSMITYLVQIYWPTVLTTGASWISFWMNYKSSVARVTVGLTSMLILNTLNSHLRDQLPQFACIKAMDVYMVVCLFFVFLTLMEYVYINYLIYTRRGFRFRYRKHRRPRRPRRIMNRTRYQESGLQPPVYQRHEKVDISSVDKINNHITNVDEEGPLPLPSQELINVGFDSTNYPNLFPVPSKGDQVNFEDGSGYPPSIPVQAYLTSPKSLDSLTYVSEQAPLTTSESLASMPYVSEQAPLTTAESLASMPYVSGQAWVATGENPNDLSSISEQGLQSYGVQYNGYGLDGSIVPTQIYNYAEAYGYPATWYPQYPEVSYSLDENYGHDPSGKYLPFQGQNYVQEASCNPGEIHTSPEEFVSVPDDTKVECNEPDPKKQLQNDAWNNNGDDFTGFDEDEDSDSESEDTFPLSPGYFFREKFVHDLFEPDYVPKVDKWSRILFPLAFVIFNIIYWPYNDI